MKCQNNVGYVSNYFFLQNSMLVFIWVLFIGVLYACIVEIYKIGGMLMNYWERHTCILNSLKIHIVCE